MTIWVGALVGGANGVQGSYACKLVCKPQICKKFKPQKIVEHWIDNLSAREIGIGT